MDGREEASRSLVMPAASGDEAAVEALVTRHLPALRVFVRLRMGSLLSARESASDLVQSTCREVLGDLSRFHYTGEAAFRKWLFTAAVNKIRQDARYCRAARRDAGLEAAAPSTAETGRSKGAVRVFLHRALARLAVLMASGRD